MNVEDQTYPRLYGTYRGEDNRNAFQRMEDLAPDKNPVITAIKHLKTAREIREFMRGYERYLIRHPNDSTKGREIETARSNVGYILGYFDDAVQRKWYRALPEVSHPVFGYGFGRGYNPTPEEAFKMGQELGEEINKRKKIKVEGRWKEIEV